MKRIVLLLALLGVVGVGLAPTEADAAYYRRPLLRRGVAVAARVGVGYGMSRAYGGYGYGYRGYYPGYGYGYRAYPSYGYGYRPGFGIGFY